jgi:hypothetical protein
MSSRAGHVTQQDSISLELQNKNKKIVSVWNLKSKHSKQP